MEKYIPSLFEWNYNATIFSVSYWVVLQSYLWEGTNVWRRLLRYSPTKHLFENQECNIYDQIQVDTTQLQTRRNNKVKHETLKSIYKYVYHDSAACGITCACRKRFTDLPVTDLRPYHSVTGEVNLSFTLLSIADFSHVWCPPQKRAFI